jgi:hypothetical protein
MARSVVQIQRAIKKMTLGQDDYLSPLKAPIARI